MSGANGVQLNNQHNTTETEAFRLSQGSQEAPRVHPRVHYHPARRESTAYIVASSDMGSAEDQTKSSRKRKSADSLTATEKDEESTSGNKLAKKQKKNCKKATVHKGTNSASVPSPEAKLKYSAEQVAEFKKRKVYFQKQKMLQPKLFLVENTPRMNGSHISPNGSDKEKNINSPKTKIPTIRKRKEPVTLTEVLYLLQYGLLGNAASFQPSWCKLIRVAKVKKVVFIILNGVTSRVYRRKRHCFPNIASKSFSAKVIPALSYFAMLQDVLSTLKSNTRFSLHKHRIIAAMKYEKAVKENQMNEELKLIEGKEENVIVNGQTQPGKTYYLVSREEMKSRGYPCPDDPGCVHTSHVECVNDQSPIIGIDCEMVLTSAGSELARVSVTDEKGKMLYNSLVKPTNPVRDYLTKYSGITKKLLDPVETRLADAQKAVIGVLPEDAILVGQGLENDLRALKIYHPHCVDTSNMFTASGRRVKLKLLAKEYLNRDIQCSTAGHDSIEDAVASMDLFKLKLAKGDQLRNYYRECSSGPVFAARESIFELAEEQGKKVTAVDTRFTLKKFKKEPVSCVVCSNDKEICKKACSALSSSDFVCMQLHGYNNLTQGNTVDDVDIETTLSLMDERVGTVLEALPHNSLHVILMPGTTEMRHVKDPKRGDYKMRHGRCVVGLKLGQIKYPDNR
ncbi:small RNA degrading nuclease 5-like isoform X4 [Lytechinus variegatus]|uniref:small RNA degrading nuclease 5-like isoform X4 n=1 Tax=Lytechinus variegatus TaxID=7654 RepID=UPI001BB260D6|nr:small RNA degrading nuclease 5-like isoform X4 [Lytechinus variegatus]